MEALNQKVRRGGPGSGQRATLAFHAESFCYISFSTMCLYYFNKINRIDIHKIIYNFKLLMST